ncbi:hypothetical protein HYC85_013898 [Camellia sinensis]|uniref:Secreted protein n=1 Tax=Camellia sinensis TaxID=4442 RepID=A0A7J7H6Q9_CAMSI|nr:hypothetical protein HYC85_013898 [Camellia sinensis]
MLVRRLPLSVFSLSISATLSSSPKSLTTVKAKQAERELIVPNRESANLVRNRSRRRGMTNPLSSETLQPTETLEIENGLSLVPRMKLLLTIHCANHSVKPLDDW